MSEPKIGVNRGNAGKGRPKGSTNKIQAAVKDMVVQALSQAGGIDYLVAQSRDNPTAFLTLVGKVIPLQSDVTSGGQSLAGAGPLVLQCNREA